VLEAQEDNSGVLVSCVGQRRGAFLTRGRVPKPGTRGAASFYEAEDMRVGATLDLHGTRLALTKAVESTREYLQNDPDRADEPFEVDAAEATARDAGDTLVGKPRRSARPEAMSRGPRQKLDPTKTAKDAGFGPLRPCPLPKRRPTSSVERFFAHVHTVLRFVCVYDDPVSDASAASLLARPPSPPLTPTPPPPPPSTTCSPTRSGSSSCTGCTTTPSGSTKSTS